jgi:hypothetical protein
MNMWLVFFLIVVVIVLGFEVRRYLARIEYHLYFLRMQAAAKHPGLDSAMDCYLDAKRDAGANKWVAS